MRSATGRSTTDARRESQADAVRPSVWRRLSPGVIAVGYGLVGLVWIVVSDLLAAEVGVDGLDVNLSLVKGVGFVLVTGSLLFTVLRRREQWLTAAREQLSRWVGSSVDVGQNSLRVLVIDPDPADQDRLRSAMTSTAGATIDVEQAMSYTAGRRAILRHSHDVILVEERLGNASGLDLIGELHEFASGPMIVVTDSDDPAIDRAAQRAGAHDYLLKHEIDPSWIGRTLRYAAANWSAQKELSKTRQWYAEIFQEAPVGLFRSSPEGELTEGNLALLTIFGAESVEEIRRVGIGSLYRDPGTRTALTERISSGETIEDEDVAMQRLDGTPIAVRLRMRGLSNSDGLMALYGSVVDVTLELDRERHIRTQASMLDQVKNAVIGTDRHGTVTYWNRAAELLFGWTTQEAVGRPVTELTPAPSERARTPEIMAAMADVGAWEGEYLCRRKDGSEFPAYVSNAALTDAAGRVTGFVGVTVDLTELKGAQERAAAQEAMAASVLETVRFPAAVIDGSGTIVAVNEAWTSNPPTSEPRLDSVEVGMNYLDACDSTGSADGSIVAGGIREVLAGAEARFSHEYPHANRWLRLEVAEAVKPVGGAVVMHIDITNLRDAARQAEEFARSKDRLIASVSHELRTPLTAVLGFADLIESPEELGREEMSQFAAEIHRQATDMAAIVEDLLVAARAEMGALTIRAEPVDLDSQIDDVMRNLKHHPSISVQHRKARVPLVEADPLRLRQILRNLVNNALRYGGSQVVIGTVTEPERVLIRVSDDGPGVPADLAEAIFEPFFSAHDRRGQPDSLGLGLSVVRTLTEAMGGTVGMTTDQGWTVFTVALPRTID